MNPICLTSSSSSSCPVEVSQRLAEAFLGKTIVAEFTRFSRVSEDFVAFTRSTNNSATVTGIVIFALTTYPFLKRPMSQSPILDRMSEYGLGLGFLEGCSLHKVGYVLIYGCYKMIFKDLANSHGVFDTAVPFGF